jgi:hypothetical protein
LRALPEHRAAIDEVNARFRAEVERYGLRFRCSSCAHVVAAERACSLDYPNQTLVGEIRAIEPDGALVFCKYFELGEDDAGN